jgi:crossover junction endodeoxyribonuclease RuvC
MSEQILMGVDPGSRALGYGIIQRRGSELKPLTWGVIRPKAVSLAERLGEIAKDLGAIISEYKPCHFVVEKVFMAKNPESAFILGHARGVVLSLAGLQKAKVTEYATRSVKKIVTGQGGAEKDHVRRVVEILLNIKVTELDATDALAMAITEARLLDEAELLAKQNRILKGARL